LIPEIGGKKPNELKLNGAVVFPQGKQAQGTTVRQEAEGTRLLLRGAGRFEVVARY